MHYLNSPEERKEIDFRYIKLAILYLFEFFVYWNKLWLEVNVLGT